MRLAHEDKVINGMNKDCYIVSWSFKNKKGGLQIKSLAMGRIFSIDTGLSEMFVELATGNTNVDKKKVGNGSEYITYIYWT